MTYTEEQLQQIDQFASIYLRPTDIAVILGVRVSELRSLSRTSKTSPIRHLRRTAMGKH